MSPLQVLASRQWLWETLSTADHCVLLKHSSTEPHFLALVLPDWLSSVSAPLSLPLHPSLPWAVLHLFQWLHPPCRLQIPSLFIKTTGLYTHNATSNPVPSFGHCMAIPNSTDVHSSYVLFPLRQSPSPCKMRAEGTQLLKTIRLLLPPQLPP